jgi:hypothetical protein
MSAFGVVGAQDLADENEEIKEPADSERRFDRCSALAFTELVVQDMRMGHVLAAFRVIRLLGIAAIAVRMADLLPGKRDSKGAQMDSLQLDAGRHGADRMRCQINGDLVEFVS